MWRLILACTLYFAAMACAFVALAVALAGSAKADTWCAVPGPSGEALYCTDEHDMLPASVKDRAVLFTGKLRDYRKLTVSQRQPALHAWPRPLVRERWTRWDDGTLVNDRDNGVRRTWTTWDDGTVVEVRPASDEGWTRTPTGWRRSK